MTPIHNTECKMQNDFASDILATSPAGRMALPDAADGFCILHFAFCIRRARRTA